jgi:hypothetical protein
MRLVISLWKLHRLGLSALLYSKGCVQSAD